MPEPGMGVSNSSRGGSASRSVRSGGDSKSYSSSSETKTESITNSPTTEEKLSGKTTYSKFTSDSDSESKSSSDSKSAATGSESKESDSSNPNSNIEPKSSSIWVDTSSLSGGLAAAKGTEDQTQESKQTNPGNAGVDTVVSEIASRGSNGAVGYNATIYGEVGVGVKQVQVADELRFGRINEATTIADKSFTTRTQRFDNYGIDEFSKGGFRSTMAGRSMVHSQATWYLGNKILDENPRLKNKDLVFEKPRSQPSADGRVIDITTPAEQIEVKAAKGYVPKQLNLDAKAASAGQTVNYVYTNNPLTRASGPLWKQ